MRISLSDPEVGRHFRKHHYRAGDSQSTGTFRQVSAACSAFGGLPQHGIVSYSNNSRWVHRLHGPLPGQPVSHEDYFRKNESLYNFFFLFSVLNFSKMAPGLVYLLPTCHT